MSRNRPPRYFLVGGVSMSSVFWTFAAFVFGAALVIVTLVLLALKGLGL